MVKFADMSDCCMANIKQEIPRHNMHQTATDKLLLILKSELWECNTESLTITPEEYRSIMRMATMQTVAGMVANFVSKQQSDNVRISPEDAVKTIVVQHRIESRNRLLNSEVVELKRVLDSEGIPFFVFKGQTLATLYPAPLSRTSGDIDFYVPREHFDNALKLLCKKWNIEAERGDSHHHVEFCHNDVCFEMHFEMLKFFSKKRQKTFDAIIGRAATHYVEINGEKIPTLDPATNIAYTFGHLWYHLLEIGVGMRQLCDLAVLIDRTFKNDDGNCKGKAEKLRNILQDLGYIKAFCAIENELKDYLGLSVCPVKNNVSGKYSRALMKRTISYGNFGKYGRKGNRMQFGFYIRLTIERISTFLKFHTLDRKEIRARLLNEIPEKIMLFFKK